MGQYVKLFSLYPMPTSIHIFLIHGHAIIESSVMPIGQISKDVQEARNKGINYIEKVFQGKIHGKQILDVFHRLLVSSELLISSLHKFKPKVGPGLSSEVIEFLTPVQHYKTTQIEEENILEG